jgi:Protein of unknown function (DUF 659)
VSTTLLDNSYQSVKQEVEEYVDKQDNLCISFNESNDVANNRIINIAVITEKGVFFVENIDLGAAAVTAEYCTELIEQRVQVISKGLPKRLNLSVFLPFLLAIIKYSGSSVLLVLCLYREISYTR